MNEQNNMNNVNQTNSDNGYVDPRKVEAEVLGELRKAKIGKPSMVIQFLALFVLVLVALPVVTQMLDDENSALSKLLKRGSSVAPVTTTAAKTFLDGSVEQALTGDTVMEYNNIVMKEFVLSSGSIRCVMYSYNGVLNLDEEEYYLEIYSNNKNFVNYVKLTGTYDYQEKAVTFTSEHMNFNDTLNYFGKIVLMENANYPDVTITSDESGIGSFTCVKGGRSIQYIFENNYLIRIRDTDKILINDYKENTQVYVNLLDTYRKKVAKLPNNAAVEEVADGFLYTADVDLKAEGFVLPLDLNDYNYYRLDSEAKVVHYAMVGKGFDCE